LAGESAGCGARTLMRVMRPSAGEKLLFCAARRLCARWVEHRKQTAQGRTHLSARHDRVEHPMLEEKFSALKILRKICSSGLLRHSPTGEANQCARLRKIQVT
jgi:hypothetical protein